MTPEAIRTALETARRLPRREVSEAVRQADALAPLVVDVLERAASGVYLLPRQDRLLFYGLHAMAAGRATSVYRPLMALLRRPEEEIDDLFGDAVAMTLPGIVLAVFDGDPEPLITVIEDRSVHSTVRSVLLSVLARLTFDGAVPRERTLAAIDRFDCDRLADDGDLAWLGWEAAVMLLGLAERADRVRAAWVDGRNPGREVDQRQWEEDLSTARANPTDPSRSDPYLAVPLDDPVVALSRLEKGSEPAAKATARTTVADDEDPAAGIRLDAEEIDWLAGFLASAHVPATAMSLEELDGFVTALVVGPETVLPSEYMPHLWRSGDGEGPVYDSLEQAEYVLGLLTRHWNTIATRLARSYPHAPLIWCADDGNDGQRWAIGFGRGVHLRQQAWEPLLKDTKSYLFLAPVLLLGQDESTLTARPLAPEERTRLIRSLTLSTLGIHAFWKGRKVDRPAVVPRSRRKVGRNEPCPCGSGRKHKLCCGR
ncbi:MAG: UPF0149 family protein [Rhodospirillales bacterium]